MGDVKIVGAFMDSDQKDFGPNEDFGKPSVLTLGVGVTKPSF